MYDRRAIGFLAFYIFHSIKAKGTSKKSIALWKSGRAEKANDEIGVPVALLHGVPHELNNVKCAIIEFATQSLQQASRRRIIQGENEIVLFPSTLSVGRHAITDIPEQVEGINKRFTGLDIRVTGLIETNGGTAGYLFRRDA